MSTDSIISHYSHFQYNSKFDMVLMNSTYSLDMLSKNEVLHTIPEAFLWKNRSFVSPDLDWIILGIDPYVVGGVNSKKNFQYNELTYGKKWKRDLNEEEIASFQAAVLFQFGRKNLNKSLSWLEKIENQTINAKDTIEAAPYFLSRLSKVKAAGQPFVYPNQTKKFGVFYDGIGMGIIRHSSKYGVALLLIEYYSNLVFNQELCNKLNVLPVQNPNRLSLYSYQNDYPVLFRCTPQKTVPLFRDLNRIRKRI